MTRRSHTRSRWEPLLFVVVLLGCPSSPKPKAPPPPEDPVEDAAADLDEGERILAVAAGDCGSACVGLRKVIRATKRLCSTQGESCVEARKREKKAVGQVESMCDPCGGP